MTQQQRITRFDGDYAWLSNFWPVMVRFEFQNYPSVEHAYVAAKTLDLEIRKVIRTTPTAGQAKRLGRQIILRPDWNEVRDQIMHDLLIQKFRDPNLRALLMATGDAHLEEGNTWGDRYWGTCAGQGKNQLGKLLMAVRTSLKTKSLF